MPCMEMSTDRARWDHRHADERDRPTRAPDPFVVEVLDSLGEGADRRALDLACGTGRHALLAAERGFCTAAWDVSAVGLEITAARARERGLAVETREIDLSLPLPGAEPFDLIIVVDFLDRRLFAELHTRLRPGASAVLATFSEDWPEPHPSPRYRLERGELARGLPVLDTVRSIEIGGRAGLWARAPGRPRPGGA